MGSQHCDPKPATSLLQVQIGQQTHGLHVCSPKNTLLARVAVIVLIVNLMSYKSNEQKDRSHTLIDISSAKTLLSPLTRIPIEY